MATDVQHTFWFTLAGTLAIGWASTTWRTLVRRKRRHERRARYLEGVRFLLDDKPDRALEVFLSLARDRRRNGRHAFRARQPVPAARRNGARHPRAPAHRRSHQPERRHARRGADRTGARLLPRRPVRPRGADRSCSWPTSGREPALALSHLVRIYEIQHEWQQAAEAHQRWRSVGVPEQPAAIAHFYCEMAETAIAAQALRRGARPPGQRVARAERFRPQRDPARRPGAAAGRPAAGGADVSQRDPARLPPAGAGAAATGRRGAAGGRAAGSSTKRCRN